MDFEQISRFTRINVVGTSGSGKSTFARKLAGLLNLPYYEMDQLFWKADWQESSDDELFRKVHDVTSQSSWVLDGNYTRTIPIKWKHVQLVIWLNPSLVRTTLQVTKRTICRALTQQEIWPETGNRESLRKAFLSKDSIIWWVITTHRKHRKRYTSITASPAHSHISFIRLNSHTDVASFLEGLRDVGEQAHPSRARTISSGESSPSAR